MPKQGSVDLGLGRSRHRRLIGVILAATVAVFGLGINPVGAQDSVGMVKKAFGKAAIVRMADGAETVVPADIGTAVFSGDALSTGDNGGIGVIFDDNTVFSLGPNSQVVIDEFVYKPREGEASFVASALSGSFKYLSGGISRVNRDGVQLRLPVATMGVRGTHLAAVVPQPGVPPHGLRLGQLSGRELMAWQTNFNKLAPSKTDALAFEGMHVVTLLSDPDGTVGAATVATQAGQTDLVQANTSTLIPSVDQPPSSPLGMTPRSLGRLYAGAFKATPTREEGFPESFILYFNSGSAGFTPETQAALSGVLAELSGRQAPEVRVVGHTDRQGGDADNLRLSELRTAAVRQALIDSGVPAAWISTAYHGEGEPLFPTADEVSEPRNRRVEVTVR